MALRTAVAVGVVTAIVIPWYCSSQDPPILGGLLDGQSFYGTIGSSVYTLHWSWPVFCLVTLLAWGLLAAAEQRY